MVKNPPANTGDVRYVGLTSGLGRSSGESTRKSTPVCLPGESHGQESLVSYSPWGCKESDMTEPLTLTYAVWNGQKTTTTTTTRKTQGWRVERVI